MSRRGTNIRKRKDGRWEGRYYIPDNTGGKKCKSVYGHSYKEASEKLLNAKATIQNQMITDTQNTGVVNDVAEKWLDVVKTTRKPATYQKYSNIYNKYIKPKWGKFAIEELTQSEFSCSLPKTLGESTLKSILSTFNLILEYGNRTFNTKLIHLSYKTVHTSVISKSNTNTINITDQKKLTEYLLTELDVYKLGILLCLFMGLRLGEVCALKWDDIDTQCRILHISRTVQRLRITTSSENCSDSPDNLKTALYVTSPKTVHSQREIPIPDFIFEKLIEYYDEIKNHDTYMLKGRKPMDPRTYQYKFHNYLKEAGIEYIHFHSLRHTFATNCISSGADAKSVSEILGHSNVNITLNRYVHPDMETKRNAINSISVS